MSQLQGNSFINANKALYWPGHVVAESLVDENDADDSIFENETPKRKQSDSAKSRTSSMASNQRHHLSRNSSQVSNGSISETAKNYKDFNTSKSKTMSHFLALAFQIILSSLNFFLNSLQYTAPLHIRS